jgi:hypothetical protein
MLSFSINTFATDCSVLVYDKVSRKLLLGEREISLLSVLPCPIFAVLY